MPFGRVLCVVVPKLMTNVFVFAVIFRGEGQPVADPCREWTGPVLGD